jgi:hypothetical protein
VKSAILLIITFLVAPRVSAQPAYFALSGSVRDSSTGKPIPAVSVFLNGTSKGTVTNDDGTFLLDGILPGGYQLVISTIGYATFQIEINTQQLPPNLNVTLQTRAVELAAATVEPADKDGWRKWGRLFWNIFIGTTRNASYCTIENKDVLRFHFNPKSKKVTVSAFDPLIIVNKALGYTIEYRLETFSYNLSGGAFEFDGHPLFREMTPGDSVEQQTWESNRQLAYLGSVLHFMRSLYKGRLREEGFVVGHEVRSTKRKKQIKTVYNYDSLVTINHDKSRTFSFIGDFIVIYGNGDLGIPFTRSVLELLSPVSIRIEENGSYFPLLSLYMQGSWAKTQTVGNIVPIDYVPPPLP